MSELRKNLPQSQTLLPAFFILLTGGMNIAWSLGFTSGMIISQHLMYCWFIGGIIGAVAIPFVINKLPVKWLLLCSSAFVTIGGIIYVSGTLNEAALTAARYINGIAFGWTFIVCILIGGEQVVKSLRGRYLSIEALSINLGIFGQVIYAYGSDEDSVVHGIVTIIFGVIALILVFVCTIESPFYFLQRNDENNALTCIMRLQVPHVVTQETHDLLAEHKNFIAEQKIMTRSVVLREGLIAMAKVSLHRCFVAMSFALPLNLALVLATLIGPNVMWPFSFYSLMRLIGSFIFLCFTQKIGRKKPVLLSLPICAGMLIGVGCLFNNSIDENAALTAIVLLLIYQFFAGIYMGPSGAQISEAFPLQLKPFFMAGVVIIEMLLHIIIVVVMVNSDITITSLATYCFALAALTLAYTAFVYFFIPETTETTLREAQAKFSNIISSGLN